MVAPGINGKMNEISAAFGLLQLQHIDNAIAQRSAIDAQYRQRLSDVRGIRCVTRPAHSSANYAYFPVLVQDHYPLSRDALYHLMREHGILVRRYFYPLISDLPMYRALPSSAPAWLPVARSVAAQVLCLPIFPGLSSDQVDTVADLIAGQQAT